MVSIDLLKIYLEQGRVARFQELVGDTAELFRTMGVPPDVRKTLDLGKLAHLEGITDLRSYFAGRARLLPPRKSA